MGRSVRDTGRRESGDNIGFPWSLPGALLVDLIMTKAVGQKMAMVCTTQLSCSIREV